MTDIERAFNEICDQLGCAYDNEAALFAIDKLQKSVQSNAEPVAWREALENAIRASSLPEYKETDAEFMRGSLRLANEYARIALTALDTSAGLIEAAVRSAFEEAAQIADSFGDRHEEYEPGDAIRARAADRTGA